MRSDLGARSGGSWAPLAQPPEPRHEVSQPGLAARRTVDDKVLGEDRRRASAERRAEEARRKAEEVHKALQLEEEETRRTERARQEAAEAAARRAEAEEDPKHGGEHVTEPAGLP